MSYERAKHVIPDRDQRKVLRELLRVPQKLDAPASPEQVLRLPLVQQLAAYIPRELLRLHVAQDPEGEKFVIYLTCEGQFIGGTLPASAGQPTEWRWAELNDLVDILWDALGTAPEPFLLEPVREVIETKEYTGLCGGQLSLQHILGPHVRIVHVREVWPLREWSSLLHEWDVICTVERLMPGWTRPPVDLSDLKVTPHYLCWREGHQQYNWDPEEEAWVTRRRTEVEEPGQGWGQMQSSEQSEAFQEADWTGSDDMDEFIP